MNKKIIEINNNGYSLSKKRGFLAIENPEENQSHRIPLCEILSLIISANNMMISKNLINAITNEGGVIICCGDNYMPDSIILPYSSHWQNGERIRKQINASVSIITPILCEGR